MRKLGFISSSGRSGSTLLASMLNMHSRIHVPVELIGLYSWLRWRLPFYGDLTKGGNAELLVRDLKYVGQLNKFGVELSTEETLRLLNESDKSYGGVLTAFYSALLSTTRKDVLIDKTPNSARKFEVMHRYFPEAKIIHLVRDGRDVALSSMAHRGGMNYRNLLELANDWRYTNASLADFGNIEPAIYTLVRYEDLVADPEDTLKRLCEFLGEEYEEKMLGFWDGDFASKNATQLNHHKNLSKPIMTSNIRKWPDQMDAESQTIYTWRAQSTLERFGYDNDKLPLTVRNIITMLALGTSTFLRKILRMMHRSRVNVTFILATFYKRLVKTRETA